MVGHNTEPKKNILKKYIGPINGTEWQSSRIPMQLSKALVREAEIANYKDSGFSGLYGSLTSKIERLELTEDHPHPYFCSGFTIFLQRKAQALGELKTS